MSNLYKQIEEIINASTLDEAAELLYNKDNIAINSPEHYEKVISKFIKKKENILPKDEYGNVIYNLDENILDIWNTVFISQIIKKNYFESYGEDIEKLEEKKENLEKEIYIIEDELNNKILEHRRPNVTLEKHLIISKESEIIKNNKLTPKVKKLEKTKKELNKLNNFFSTTDNIIIKTNNNVINNDDLKENIKELKESILIIIKIRNSFSHRGDNIEPILINNKIITIKNRDLKLKTPTEYLEGYVKGIIKVKEEDKNIIEKTNTITEPLFKKLNHKSIKTYNIEPNKFSILLDGISRQYDHKTSQNIFGINNPKIIGILIYANNILSKYSKKMASDITLNSNDFIKLSMKDTFKYKNNITAITMNKEEYINQFNIKRIINKKDLNIIENNYKNSGYHQNTNHEYFNPYIDEYDKNYTPFNDDIFKPVLTEEEIKKNILNKLRNSTIHFRFKQVKDNNGNIIEDKIYLYDENNIGINEFNIIIDIKTLLSIIRTIDKEISKIKIADNNYRNSGYYQNTYHEYFNPYIDEYDNNYNPRQDELFNKRKVRTK